jgi:hypothetical protein
VRQERDGTVALAGLLAISNIADIDHLLAMTAIAAKKKAAVIVRDPRFRFIEVVPGKPPDMPSGVALFRPRIVR